MLGLPSSDSTYLVGADWNHGMGYDFPETVGNGKSSQLTSSLIFFRWVGIPTTNQHLVTGIISHLHP